MTFDSRRYRLFLQLLVLALAPASGTALSGSARAAQSASDLMKSAQSAFERGDPRQALDLVRKVLEREPDNPQAVYFSGRLHDALGRHEEAVKDFTALLKIQPNAPHLYQLRGSAYFKQGRIDESIADFDLEIELMPGREPYHWQRGISYYYAGQFEKGRQQFESHQSVNANDVENAVWHYLCVARRTNVEKAREGLITISGDGRVPMMEIHALFAGRETPESVLAAAEKGEVSEDERKQRRFYAHLYIGLYYEVQGKPDLARRHILKASGEFSVNHFMGDVAKVHAKLRGYSSEEADQ